LVIDNFQNMNKTTTPHKDRRCFFCVNGLNDIDYKDVSTLQKFVSSYGKIVSKKRTKACSLHQRKIAEAIKRDRTMALLPFINR